MQSVQNIRRKEFSNKNFILFITLGASSFIKVHFLFYLLTGLGFVKTISMAIPLVLTIVTFGLSRVTPTFERIFPWVAIAATAGAALFSALYGEPSLATVGIAFFIARTILYSRFCSHINLWFCTFICRVTFIHH